MAQDLAIVLRHEVISSQLKVVRGEKFALSRLPLKK
jgi:hypothetical protein